MAAGITLIVLSATVATLFVHAWRVRHRRVWVNFWEATNLQEYGARLSWTSRKAYEEGFFESAVLYQEQARACYAKARLLMGAVEDRSKLG